MNNLSTPLVQVFCSFCLSNPSKGRDSFFFCFFGWWLIERFIGTSFSFFLLIQRLVQLLFCIFLFSFHSNQGKHLRTSAGPSVASYVPSGHKLQQNGLQLENVFVGHIRAVPSYACTGTELGLTSKDDSWVGEGHGIDGQTSIGLQGSVPLAESDFVGMKQYSTQLVVRIQMIKLDTLEKSKKLRCIIVVSTSCHHVFPCNSWLIITFSFYFCSTLYSYSHLLFALVAICSLNL